ncbi:hypothetical protein B0A55_02782 [Friedmanniomyces simplex]|uniref:Uncharacterized protein n=1 Tax=Friedmanniomyces simplex TaxID=329884 RepID=A0A4U0XQQ0_9PEZI|nr:hypothetical protein B0A55_02782 [Friedmanniomyces simplex]
MNCKVKPDIFLRLNIDSPAASTPDRFPELDAIQYRKAANGLEYVTKTGESAQASEPDDDLDFRLFATPSAPGAAKAESKIRLRSPTPQTTAAGFIVMERDRRYYFADAFTTATKETYVRVALSGAQILALSRTPWPGSAYPWKVLNLPPVKGKGKTQPAQPSDQLTSETGGASKRKRPGKKARIQIRAKLATSRVEAGKREVDAAAREAVEREKRVRLNRVKKLRKRARDKAKKAQAERNDTNDDGD